MAKRIGSNEVKLEIEAEEQELSAQRESPRPSSLHRWITGAAITLGAWVVFPVSVQKINVMTVVTSPKFEGLCTLITVYSLLYTGLAVFRLHQYSKACSRWLAILVYGLVTAGKMACEIAYFVHTLHVKPTDVMPDSFRLWFALLKVLEVCVFVAIVYWRPSEYDNVIPLGEKWEQFKTQLIHLLTFPSA